MTSRIENAKKKLPANGTPELLLRKLIKPVRSNPPASSLTRNTNTVCMNIPIPYPSVEKPFHIDCAVDDPPTEPATDENTHGADRIHCHQGV